MLDIGSGAGAALLVTPAALCGHEIEIRRAGHAWDGTHVAVRQRNGGTRTQFAAIFGPLTPGRYEFRLRGGVTAQPCVAAEVSESSVVRADWPDDERAELRRLTGESPA